MTQMRIAAGVKQGGSMQEQAALEAARTDGTAAEQGSRADAEGTPSRALYTV